MKLDTKLKTAQRRMVDTPIMDHLSVRPINIAIWNATHAVNEDTRVLNADQNRISTTIQQLVRRMTTKW